MDTGAGDARVVDAMAGISQKVATRAAVSYHMCYTLQTPVQTHVKGDGREVRGRRTLGR